MAKYIFCATLYLAVFNHWGSFNLNTLFPNMCFSQYFILATKIQINDCLFQVGHTLYTGYL